MRPKLSKAQLTRVLKLVRDVDSVELKLTVPVEEHRATFAGLPLDLVEAEPRQVFFFDTPDLTLNRAGIVVRARRIRGGGGDTVVKLRPVVPAKLPAKLRESESFKVELDFLPGGFVCSGSLKGKVTGDQVRAVAEGEMPLRKLLTREQRGLYGEHAPPTLPLESLVLLGPTFTLRLGFRPKRLKRKMVAEFWLYPDGSRLLELSTKCAPAEAVDVGAQLRDYLTAHGISIRSLQRTKARTALEFFARELRAKASARPGRRTREAP